MAAAANGLNAQAQGLVGTVTVFKLRHDPAFFNALTSAASDQSAIDTPDKPAARNIARQALPALTASSH